MATALKTGTLATGRKYELVMSEKSAVPEGKGKHLILHFVDDADHAELSHEDKSRLLGIATMLASKICEDLWPGHPGRWRIALNGPQITTRKTFHVHIMCVAPDAAVRRIVDNIVEE